MTSVILLFSTIFFSDVLFFGKVFFAGDNLSINAPAKVLLFKMLENGHLPLWNPFNFSGTPFLADINLGLLSPFNIFYLFLPPLIALTFSIVVTVTAAGIGMYWYGRTLKLSSFSACVTALVFMFSGSMMTHTMNTAILNTIVWLPFIFIAVENLIQKKQLKYALFASILLTLSFFGGHIQYFYYISLFVFLYVFASPCAWKEKIKYICFIFVPVFFLSAVQLFPFLEYARYSTRPPQNLDYAGSVPLVTFIHLLLPNFFGVMKDGTSWGATADINGYIGIIPLIISFIVFLKSKVGRIRFFGFAVLICILIALGKHSPVYLFCFYVLPFFSRFRSPTSILIIYTFALSLLTGYGTHYFFESGKLKLNKKVIVSFIAVLAVLFLVFLFIRFNAFNEFSSIMHGLNEIKKTAFITRFLEYSPSRMQVIFNLWSGNFISLIFTLLIGSFFLFVVKIQGKISPYLKFLFILIIASELMFFAGNNYIVSPPSVLKTYPGIEKFFDNDQGLYRILVLSDPGAKPPFADPKYFEDEGRKAMNLLQPNTNIFLEMQSITGYASIVPSYYASYMQSNTADPTSIALPTPSMEQLNELGVKYVITAGRFEKELIGNKKYRLALEYKDTQLARTFHIYENTAYYPRVYILDDKSNFVSSANISSYAPNRITISAMAFKKGMLVLSEMYYPGWSATVNGKKIEISKYKVFRSIPIEKGQNKIVFTYLPFSFIAGAAISLINWFYVLVFLGYMFWKEHKKVGKKLHIGKSKIKKNA